MWRHSTPVMLVFGEDGWKLDNQEFLAIFVWLVRSQPGPYGVCLRNNVKKTKAKTLKSSQCFPSTSENFKLGQGFFFLILGHNIFSSKNSTIIGTFKY